MMLDRTLQHAFEITRKHKALWVLGLLAALASGGIGGLSGSNWQSDRPWQMPMDMTQWPGLPRGAPVVTQTIPDWLPAAILALVVGLGIVGLFVYCVGIIAQGGLIAGVQSVETAGTLTFSSAWRAGFAKFGRLFGLRLLVGLPAIVVSGVLAVGAAASFAFYVTNGLDRARDAMVAVAPLIILAAGALVCLSSVYSLLASALNTLGDRAIMLEEATILASLRKSWQLLRTNLGEMVVLALVLLLINVVVSVLAGMIVAIFVIPFAMLTAAASSDATRVLGVMLALGGGSVAVVAACIIAGILQAFTSATWTLVYRDFTGVSTPTSKVHSGRSDGLLPTPV